MRIRPYAPVDAAHLQRLLHRIWGEDPVTLGYHRFGESRPEEERLLRTVVAEQGGRLLGFGSLWNNRFHPNALNVGINVDPAEQGRGTGRRLFEQVERLNTRRLPLQTAVWAHCDQGMRFLTRLGFTELRRTYFPQLPIEAVEPGDLQGWESRCLAAGYRIYSLSQLAADIDRNPRVAALCAEVYAASHAENPPAAMTLTQWEALIFDETLEPGGSYVAVRDGEWAAISLLHKTDQPDQPELGWVGVAREHRGMERDLVLALTLHQVTYAGRCGCQSLTAEIDSTNPWAMIQQQELPFQPSPAWVTFRRK